jgi:hypothetical protein
VISRIEALESQLKSLQEEFHRQVSFQFVDRGINYMTNIFIFIELKLQPGSLPVLLEMIPTAKLLSRRFQTLPRLSKMKHPDQY